MDSKTLNAVAPRDETALIELLLTAHATRLRHARESVSANRRSLFDIARWLFREKTTHLSLGSS